MEKVYARTKGIRDDMVSGFCPGCMHSTVIKLIGEVLEEMHLLDKAACAVGVGCCGLHMDYITYDYFLAAHGRLVVPHISSDLIQKAAAFLMHQQFPTLY